MKAEYLLFNCLILIGPLLLSFDKKVRYVRYWTASWISIGIIMIPFLVWDIAVTDIHWRFNEDFTLPFRFFGLPLGEILFFISVPFACLFIWQIIITSRPIQIVNNHLLLMIIAVTGLILCILFILLGKIYTSIVCFTLAFLIFFDKIIKTHLFSQKRTGLYCILLTGLIVLFNGYLTARPVVLYESRFFSNIRIGTIPIEDFGYGYTLILSCTILFEKLKEHLNA